MKIKRIIEIDKNSKYVCMTKYQTFEEMQKFMEKFREFLKSDERVVFVNGDVKFIKLRRKK
jgi:hypothetical protein